MTVVALKPVARGYVPSARLNRLMIAWSITMSIKVVIELNYDLDLDDDFTDESLDELVCAELNELMSEVDIRDWAKVTYADVSTVS